LQAAQERGDASAADAAWTRAVAAAPSSSAALSNRGTARLQAGPWADALADLDAAVRLDLASGAAPDALTLNNRGNSRGALGDWPGAIEDFLQARESANRTARDFVFGSGGELS
jgi:tetratricopeptide (TPR) repeat protein